jgi:hypothetical protein
VTTATVPMIAHYDMYHDKTTRTVSSLLMLWDGEQLIDTSAGYADNDALVAQLLGLRPTRHAPLGAGETLYAAAADDPARGEQDEDDRDDREDQDDEDEAWDLGAAAYPAGYGGGTPGRTAGG